MLNKKTLKIQSDYLNALIKEIYKKATGPEQNAYYDICDILDAHKKKFIKQGVWSEGK